MSGEYKKTKLFLLGPLALFIRWLQEFLVLGNVLFLMAGATIAVVDLLSGGSLTILSGGFAIAWAASQGLAIEILFFVAFARAANAGRQGKYGAMLGWILVGLILAVPSFQAALAYGMVQTLHITIPQALARMNLDPTTWLVIRSLVVAFVGALDAWVSYSPEAHR